MATTSPQGGTTSLPQYLQQRTGQAPTGGISLSNPTSGTGQVGGMTKPTVTPPAAGAPQAPAAPAPTPSPYPTSATGNPTIPPAPPVAPPAPPAPPPPAGTTGQANPGDPIAMNNLRGLIEQMLGGQNRYSNDQVQAMRDQSTHALDDAKRTEEDRLRADAAGRGVYRGTGLSSSLGDLSERYVRGLADAETGLQTRVADANAQDRQSAIGNAFQFGQGEMQNQTLIANILSMLAQTGGAGGPSIPGATGDIAGVPGPQPADYSGIYQLLGTLFAPQAKAA